jgi:hypothetical protein
MMIMKTRRTKAHHFNSCARLPVSTILRMTMYLMRLDLGPCKCRARGNTWRACLGNSCMAINVRPPRMVEPRIMMIHTYNVQWGLASTHGKTSLYDQPSAPSLSHSSKSFLFPLTYAIKLMLLPPPRPLPNGQRQHPSFPRDDPRRHSIACSMYYTFTCARFPSTCCCTHA